MITQELLDYIRNQKHSGFDNQAIRQTLIASGWNPQDVDQALHSLTTDGATPAPEADTPQAPAQSEAATTVKQMGKFKASWRLFKQSLNLLRQDKEVVLFPVMTSLILMITTAVFAFGLYQFSSVLGLAEENTQRNDIAIYSVVFVYYVICFFVATYFKVALTAVVYERINGGNLSFGQGLSKANDIIGKIFVWSLLTSTVGIILKIISDRSKWLGKLVASLLGTAWNIVTLFIAPTLLLDNVSVWQSVKNSGSVFKKTWGETLILNVSFGLITFIFTLGIILFYGILLTLVLSMNAGLFGLIAVGVCFVLTIIAVSVITNSLNEIFKIALYSYARFGIIAEGFSPELIVGAVKSKNTQ